MLTKNGKVMQFLRLNAAFTSYGTIYGTLPYNIQAIDGGQYSKVALTAGDIRYEAILGLGGTDDKASLLADEWLGVSFSTSKAYIKLSTVDTTPSIDDYKIESTDISLSNTQDSVNYVYNENDNCFYVYHNFTGIYNGDSTVTLYTVKMFRNIISYGSGGNWYKDFLVVHEKLNEPITINPGDSIAFTIALKN